MGNRIGHSLLPGRVQTKSAGTGLTPRDFNASSHAARPLLQDLDLTPSAMVPRPYYEQMIFPEGERASVCA